MFIFAVMIPTISASFIACNPDGDGEFDIQTSAQAVELGLSVKWASCNVGAKSPEEYGSYFAWGETSSKSSYYENNSVTYGLSFSELESRGIINSDGNLTAEYDAATVNLGSVWRIPTHEEVKELLTNCTWKWVTVNGVKGCKVIGPNGNFIFLPAAGYYKGTSFIESGSCGDYWSATPYDDDSFTCFLFFSSVNNEWYGYCRYYGLTVRPVSK